MAIVGILAAIGLRIGAGVFQLIEELDGQWTIRSAMARFFAPIGSTVGMLSLGAVLLVVLSPAGSITSGLVNATRLASAIVGSLGAAAAFYTLTLSYSELLAKLWFAMINGLAAATLGLTGYWILRHFDANRPE